MRGLRLAALLGAVALCLGGCRETIEFRAWIEPARGNVPYAATIFCTRLSGTYRFELPDGAVIENREGKAEVTVDRLEWSATVTWSSGSQVRQEVVSAVGTNDTPQILRPRINADPWRWYLRPYERTLIDFSYHEDSLSGPASGVLYDDEWHVVEIRVRPELKALCGLAVRDSVFCPPREDGVWHALYGSVIYENACIVYPLYTGETAPNGAPYAPSPEQGYTRDASEGHDIYNGVAFPSQTVAIEVVVEDEWGHITSASFDIPVQAREYGSGSTDVDDAKFFVADRNGNIYHRHTCDLVCAIAEPNRIYFCSQSHAEMSGRTPCSVCFSVWP